MALLERDHLLAQLTTHWQQACTAGGRLVFVEGEAGIGKTSLLRAFAQTLAGQASVFSGACEALQTPRPLGAVHDIAAQSGGPLQALLDDAGPGSPERPRAQVFVAFIELLRARPALVVVEDLHWADGATLDLLRYAGRRVQHTHSLLVGSYRSDELVPGHPLRTVLGDLATSGVAHLSPAPLTPRAVQQLCDGVDVDAQQLHMRTGGNPFFVTEVLAAPAAAVPSTVQDAVLARAARLSASARAVLDAAAIAGPRVETWLLQALAAAESAAIEEGLATGVLCADGGVISFRHELARQAVLSAMTPTRALSLHRLTYSVLQNKALPRTMARLAAHAEGAGDADAVRRWAPRAAREAGARGAHLQAAQQWSRALAHTEGSAERAALLDPYADALRASGMIAHAITAKQQAAQAWRANGQRRAALRSLTALSDMYLLSSQPQQALAALQSARALQAGSADAQEQAWVDVCESNQRRHTLDYSGAVALALPALAIAEQQADNAVLLDALKAAGAALMGCARADEATACLERGLALAQAIGADLSAAMMLSNLAMGLMAVLRLDEAQTCLQRGLDWCADKDLDAPRYFQLSVRAGLHLLRGRWPEAEADANEVLGSPRAMTIARVRACSVLARLGARRGDGSAAQAQARVVELGGDGPSSTLLTQMLAAECAWLEGNDALAAQAAAAGLASALEHRLWGPSAELLMWHRLGGGNDATAPPPGTDNEPAPSPAGVHPCALEAAGRWNEAATRWRALGCPFETARALGQGDEAAQREALASARELGALALADRLRQRLQTAGARGLPRSPRATTQAHPSGLTSSEIAVLSLLSAGLRNKEIAQRLHRSPRTVEHHLESIFDKLGVRTRSQAVSAALRLGVAAAG